jgi:hypothetical protein
MEVDEYEWKSGSELEIQGIQQNASTYVIPGGINGLEILCNASYPVEWHYVPDEVRILSVLYPALAITIFVGTYHINTKGIHYVLVQHTELNLLSLSVGAEARRESRDINDPSTFSYSMRLSLIGETNLYTGNYVCKMAGDKFTDQLSTTVFLFWEGKCEK